MKAEEFVVAFYDGATNKCFDEDRYAFEDFKEAYVYYDSYNKDTEKGDDYVKLYAYVNKTIGLILIGDFKME